MPAFSSASASFQRRLAAELHDDAEELAGLLLGAQDFEHVLGRQRLEIEPVRRVVVGRDGFRVAVDHDRFIARLVQRIGGVAAAIVELDALADAVRPAAEDDDLLAGGNLGFGARFAGERRLVGRVHVGGGRGEFGSACVDALVDRVDAELVAQFRDVLNVPAGQRRQARVGEAHRFQHAQILRVGGQAVLADAGFHGDDAGYLLQEPRIDLAHVVDFLERGAHADRLRHHAQPVGRRRAECGADGVAVFASGRGRGSRSRRGR